MSSLQGQEEEGTWEKALWGQRHMCLGNFKAAGVLEIRCPCREGCWGGRRARLRDFSKCTWNTGLPTLSEKPSRFIYMFLIICMLTAKD